MFLDEEIFCKSCYGKRYGIKGYGYGVGAGTLNMDAGGGRWAEQTGPLTGAGITFMGGNACPRCGGSVYHAEEVLAAGMVCCSSYDTGLIYFSYACDKYASKVSIFRLPPSSSGAY